MPDGSKLLLEAIDRVAPLPLFQFFFRHVPRAVRVRVSVHAHGFSFDDRRPFSFPRPVHCLPRCVIHLHDIVAIHHGRRNSITPRPHGEIGYGGRTVGRRGVRVTVIFDDEHERQSQHRCKVEAFMEIAGRRSALADVSQCDRRAALHPYCKGNSGHHRNHAAKDA